MKQLIPFFLFFLFLLASNGVTAQSQAGTWNVANVKLQFNEKWSLVTEAQLRSYHFYDHFYYYEYKTGLQYKIDKNYSVLVGIGNYNTFQEGGNFKTPMVNDEIRTWFQFTMNNLLNRVKIEHRYRIEQRFTYTGYRNRFRYRLNFVVPLNNKKMVPNTFYVYSFDELFFNDKAPYFERNRFSLGGGYQFSNVFTVQAGLLNQLDYKPGSEVTRNYFQINFLFDFLWHRRTSEVMPGIID